MTGALQHAAGARLERKDVTRAHDVPRLGILGDRRGDGARAVRRAYPRRDAFARFDGDRESRAERAGVVTNHEWQLEMIGTILGQREADQATALFGHKIDSFRSDFFSSQDQVAFVLTVLVIDEDDHLALLHVLENLRY